MRHTLMSLIGLTCTALAPLVTHAEPLAYPGNTWGQIIFPSGLIGPEKNNAMLLGRVEQGIDWFRFNQNSWKFNTYAAMGYSFDTQGLSYNNKVTPAVGMKITRSFEGSGTLDLGMQVLYERRWKDREGSNAGVQAYANWWFGWDAKKAMR